MCTGGRAVDSESVLMLVNISSGSCTCTQEDVLLRALQFLDTLIQRDVEQKVNHSIV
jgi:hypothetical protein